METNYKLPMVDEMFNNYWDVYDSDEVASISDLVCAKDAFHFVYDQISSMVEKQNTVLKDMRSLNCELSDNCHHLIKIAEKLV